MLFPSTPLQPLKVFVSGRRIRPRLMFAAKASSLPTEDYLKRRSTLVSSFVDSQTLDYTEKAHYTMCKHSSF